MVELNITHINTTSPYKVMATQNSRTLEFHTDHGVHYYIDFMLDDLLLSADVYQFSIINTNNVSSPRDWKVRDTITAILEDFFLENKSALLYICETGDGKQSMRNRLFRSWYENAAMQNEVAFFSAVIPDEDGVKNYATLIVPLLAENFEAIVSEFKNTVALFKDK